MNIREYIGNEKELTAEQVRKLPVGTIVRVHSFDRYGYHVWADYTVVKEGKKSILRMYDFYKGYVRKDIRKETERMCYTLKEK
jgi:hypothetical protein